MIASYINLVARNGETWASHPSRRSALPPGAGAVFNVINKTFGFVRLITCIHIYIYIYIYTCMCIHIYICISMYLYICISISISLSIHIYIYIYIYL